MGSSSSKFRKHLQNGDEVQALQLYTNNTDLQKGLDPNCSYGDSHQHETPLHYASRHGLKTLLRIFLYDKGGNPNKTNAKKETALHCACVEKNFQYYNVQKRRVECLNMVLNWRGATLHEGQVERIDIGALDEKKNTALHYAAASGLKECVEILVQHGSPLSLENEDNWTPCESAEKNGHDKIARFLESKIVFSNDVETEALPPIEEYCGLRAQDLQEAKDQLLVETADMLSVPLFTAEALLRNHEWSRETLLEAWMEDPMACCHKCGVTPPVSLFSQLCVLLVCDEWSRETLLEAWMEDPMACCHKCGVTPPVSLFSEKPQVQESLGSPLPSPSHAGGTAEEGECHICMSVFLLADEPVHMTCLHQFCRPCWERYLTMKIKEGDAHHITCPGYDCCMLVPVEIIENVVSRDMARRYLQFDIKAFVDSNPDMKWCPFPGCGRAVKLPEIDGMVASSSQTRLSIPSDTSRSVDCGACHYFCWECMGEAHEPCSCDNWIKWQKKIADIRPENLNGTEEETEMSANCLWLVTNSKPCPNCKSPIQKNEGCNHMKCSKCKHDFCWVCLEQWKRHNSSTGGYFKCNRYEAVKKVEEQASDLVTDAEEKNTKMQELNRFVHYYTRFKNHENSYKLEEPLLQTAKDKMMKLAEAVTDIATAKAETQFVEDAVRQLLKARRVLKCSYVYGFYLDGPGYKKIVFEFMQTELEECTEILSQMVNRPYLRTPRSRIIEQAHSVQRRRLEFTAAIAKGLVPPETPPSLKKGRRRRKYSMETEDEDLRKAIMASIQEVDPGNPWIKDASGRHTNVMALLEWPMEDSDDSDTEVSIAALREYGKCRRAGCNRPKAVNPRNREVHDHCSRRCKHHDQVQNVTEAEQQKEEIPEVILDEHMDLLRALEMSRLQYLRDAGLLHEPDGQKGLEEASSPPPQKAAGAIRPRANSSGAELRQQRPPALTPMEELDMELQRVLELSSSIPHCSALGDSRADQSTKGARHKRKFSQSRFDESSSTIVTSVPNKSVEDLYCLDSTAKVKVGHSSSTSSHSELSPGVDRHATTETSSQLSPGPGGERPSVSSDVFSSASVSPDGVSCPWLEPQQEPESPESLMGGAEWNQQWNQSALGVVESPPPPPRGMFGIIKDLSVSNIHATDMDKTSEFLAKDFHALFLQGETLPPPPPLPPLPAPSSLSSPSKRGVSTDRPLMSPKTWEVDGGGGSGSGGGGFLPPPPPRTSSSSSSSRPYIFSTPSNPLASSSFLSSPSSSAPCPVDLDLDLILPDPPSTPPSSSSSSHLDCAFLPSPPTHDLLPPTPTSSLGVSSASSSSSSVPSWGQQQQQQQQQQQPYYLQKVHNIGPLPPTGKKHSSSSGKGKARCSSRTAVALQDRSMLNSSSFAPSSSSSPSAPPALSSSSSSSQAGTSSSSSFLLRGGGDVSTGGGGGASLLSSSSVPDVDADHVSLLEMAENLLQMTAEMQSQITTTAATEEEGSATKEVLEEEEEDDDDEMMVPEDMISSSLLRSLIADHSPETDIDFSADSCLEQSAAQQEEEEASREREEEEKKKKKKKKEEEEEPGGLLLLAAAEGGSQAGRGEGEGGRSVSVMDLLAQQDEGSDSEEGSKERPSFFV